MEPVITQNQKADQFRKQHHTGKLLILPNIWDALGARLMEKAGYKSVATASVATALSNGYTDGEHIPFHLLVEIAKKITTAVSLPVTVDIERGYAGTENQLRENIRMLLDAGVVGINVEDSHADHLSLYTISEQCRKLEIIRETALAFGIPLVINARTDIFLLKIKDDPEKKAIERGKAYHTAGADCFYPILINNYESISRLLAELLIPVNVNLLKPIGDLKRLEALGVARVSVGPQLLNQVLTTMKNLADDLMQYDTRAFFERELLSRDFLDSLT